MADEYMSLRDEMLKWQDRRFTVVTGSIGLLSAYDSYVIANAGVWSMAAAFSVLGLGVSVCCLIVWYGGWSNAKVAAYLSVFHESESTTGGWETTLARLKRLHGIHRRVHTNSIFGAIYALFTIGSTCIFFTTCAKPSDPGQTALAFGLAFVCASTIYLACFRSYPRDEFLRSFRQIKENPSMGALSEE